VAWLAQGVVRDASWGPRRVGALLDGHGAGWLLVPGCVANQGALYDRFDAVVLLSPPVDILMERVVHRANRSDRDPVTDPQPRHRSCSRADPGILDELLETFAAEEQHPRGQAPPVAAVA
jgi:hypothetical protein